MNTFVFVFVTNKVGVHITNPVIVSHGLSIFDVFLLSKIKLINFCFFSFLNNLDSGVKMLEI